MVPEKDIDDLLGVWLSHAPFRLKKIAQKKEKQSILHNQTS